MSLFQNDNDDFLIKGDNGTSEGKIIGVTNTDSLKVGVTTSALPTGAATSANQATEIASLASIDAGIPAALGQTTMVNSMPVVLASNHSVISVSAIPSDGTKTTYSACAVGFVCAAAATDIFTITGSASKIIRILKIGVGGSTTAGSGVTINMSAIRRSTNDSGGTSVTQTNVPYDTTNPTATVTVRSYTANPTLGATAGTLVASRLSIPTVGASGRGNEITFYEFGTRPGQSIVLRGASEQLCINFGGATITNPVITTFVEWTEE